MTTDTAPAPTVDPEPESQAAAPRYYGFSVLLSGFARMWRATMPAFVIIIINAALQAALVFNDPVATTGAWLFYLQAAASLMVLLYTGAVLSSAALESVAKGRVKFAHAFGRAASRFWSFLGWGVLLIAILIGASLLPDVGSFPLALWIVWGLLVFLPIAAVDGRRSALAENFRAIGAHPIRWLVTWIIMSILFVVGWLLSAVNTFFVSGWISAVVAGLVAGVAVWWWLTAWACLYCSRLGAEPVLADAAEENESAPVAGTAGSGEAAVSETSETTESAGNPESAALESGSVDGEDGPANAGDSAATDGDSSTESR